MWMLRDLALASAKKYVALDPPQLRQDSWHGILAPMTPGAFYGGLPHKLAPGASGESVAIPSYLWMLLATQSSPWCLQTQLTTLSHLLSHH